MTDKVSNRRSWIAGALTTKTKEKEKDPNGQPLRRTMSNASTRPTFASQPNRPARSHSSQSIESNMSSVFESGRPLPYAPVGPVGHELSRVETIQPSTFPPRTLTIESDKDRPNRASNRYSLASFLTLGLLRDRTEDPDRGRPISSSKNSSRVSVNNGESDRERSRGRSTSPFRFRSRSTNRRDQSPSSVIEALSLDAESDTESVARVSRVRPRNAFNFGNDESSDEDGEDSEESWSETDGMDELTAQHTEANAVVASPTENGAEPDPIEPDPLGEGVNVIIPSEPYFPTTQFSSLTSGPRSNARRRRSTKVEKQDLLPITTSRPQFSRDQCTITMVHGNPTQALKDVGRRKKTYMVASDFSEESRYAVEWAIGTVLRDGDDLWIVNVAETDSKLDPPEGANVDRLAKLRSQQDRQTLAYLLVRQATGLLQRTKLHVTVMCQAWHAKNARRMILDLVDYRNPTMLIVGSRGLNRLKGILLGSTSHYLVQKSSVPVMIARRRLKRPAKKSAHLAPHRARVSLAEAAAVDKVGPGRLDKDVEVMRDELNRDEAREAVDLRLAGTDRGQAEEDEDVEEEIILVESPKS